MWFCALGRRDTTYNLWAGQNTSGLARRTSSVREQELKLKIQRLIWIILLNYSLPLTGFLGIIRNRQQLHHFCKFKANWKSELIFLLLHFQHQKMSSAQAISNWIYQHFIQCSTGRKAKWHYREIQHNVWGIKAWKWRLLWNLEMWYWCECACL